MRKIILLSVLCLALAVGNVYAAQPKPIPGNALPDFTLPAPGSGSERSYLGLSGPFQVSNVKSDLVVIQIFSMYCPYCQKDAPNMNQLFSKIESDAATKGKIKIIGVGAGNSQMEVDTFRKRYNVAFPLLPDQDYKIHDIMGQPRTPFFVVVRTKPGKVVFTKLGAYDSPEQFFDALKAALKEAK